MVDYEKKWKEMSQILKDIEKNGLEIKECGFRSSRSEYIKGKDFVEHLTKNIDKVCTDINRIMGSNIQSTSKTVINDIYNQFQQMKMISKAVRPEGDKKKIIKRLEPYEELALAYRCNCGKNHDVETLDHPQALSIEKLKQFDASFFYVVNISRSKSMIYLYLFLAVFGVLMYAMMPVWPYRMKLIVWWISYILILVISGIFIIRLIIYLFFYIFGYDIWVFPDLQNEKLGFFESFKRVISCDKRNESWISILIRLTIAIITGYIAVSVYLNPGLIDDAQNIIKEALKDFYTYGEDKLVNSWNTTAVSLKQNTPRIEDLIDLV